MDGGMTREDIIRMAREAGIAHHGLGWTCWEGQLERFAALVAAAERESLPDRRIVTAAGDPQDYINAGWNDCIDAIRARGQS